MPYHFSFFLFDAISEFESTQLTSEANGKHMSTSYVVMQAVNLNGMTAGYFRIHVEQALLFSKHMYRNLND